MLSSICMFCSITGVDLLFLVVFVAVIGGTVYIIDGIDLIDGIDSFFSSHRKKHDERKKSEEGGGKKTSKGKSEVVSKGKSTWSCPRCETENPIEFMFCGKCGYDALAGSEHAPRSRSIVLAGDVKMEMIYCPPGQFMMGEEDSEHRVAITQGFWIGKFPVTQAQWRAVMGNDPSHFSGDDLPVEQVSWDDCQEFCKRIGQGTRLPTEAEWEYASRAGTVGIEEQNVDVMAWHFGNSGGCTHPVGGKEPNAWGIHDMLGNVQEWCSDWYGEYSGDFEIDPAGSATGALRVVRGGSWINFARYCRSAYRWSQPSNRYDCLGFRLCCSAGPRE